MAPKYTFLLPAYKATFLKQALESIQAQTYEDFLVIISDDCSPEDLYAIAKPFLEDPRFSYRRNEKNMGAESLVGHWNMLVDMCQTPWLIMASDDDVYDIDFLKEMDSLQRKHPNVDLIHSRAQIIDGENVVKQRDSLYEEVVSQLEFMSQYYFFNSVSCMANHLIRSSALKNTGGFVDFPLAWNSDKVTLDCLAKNGVVNSSRILFSFRVSGINISSVDTDINISRKKISAWFDYDTMFNKLLDSMEIITYNDSRIFKKIKDCHRKELFSAITYFTHDLSLIEAIQIIRKIKEHKLYDSSLQFFGYMKFHLIHMIKNPQIINQSWYGHRNMYR